MRITQAYMGDILKSQSFHSTLQDAGLYTLDTDRESVFMVAKEPESKEYDISNFAKGNYFSLFNDDILLDDDDDAKSYSELSSRLKTYDLFNIHFHPGINGPVVPSLYYDNDSGYPTGDLFAYVLERQMFRENLDYDVKPIKGVAKIRAPPQIDVLLFQEKTDSPLGFGQLSEVYDAIKSFQKSYQTMSSSESYHLSQQVASAISDTGFYNTLILRYRNGRPIRADLEKLVDFEFDERPIHQ